MRIHGRLQADVHGGLSIVQIKDTLTLPGGGLGNGLGYLSLVAHQVQAVSVIEDRIVSAHIAPVLPLCLDIIGRRPVREGSSRHHCAVVLPVQDRRDLSLVLRCRSHIYIGALYSLAYLSGHGKILCGLKEHARHADPAPCQRGICSDLLQNTGADRPACLQFL